MAGLIEATDLEDYGLTTEQTSTLLVTRLIRSASEQVIEAAGSPIGGTTSTVTLVQPPGSTVLRLPGLPIQTVHKVTIDNHEVNDFMVVADGIYRAGLWGFAQPVQVQVEYTHGPPEVPADIQDLVCRMVMAGVINSLDGPEGLILNNGNISSVAIDDFREAYATGSGVEAVTEMTLPTRTRDRLRARFGGNSPTVGASW